MRVLREALLDLRAHRVRSALAAMSLLVAILALVGVTTVGTVARDAFIARDEQLNGRMWTMAGSMDYGALTSERLAGVTESLEQRITATGGVYALHAELVGRVATVHDSGGVVMYEDARIVLSAGRLDRVRRLPVLDGSWLPPTDKLFPGGVVLNQSASVLFGGVGTMMQVSLVDSVLPHKQHVVGIVNDGRSEPRIYQSLHSALHLQPSIADMNAGLAPELLVHYAGASEADSEEKIREVAAALRVPPDSVQIRPVSGLRSFLESLRLTQLGFAAVSVVTLVVAVIGLLNIGLATLRERVRELSLRRAIGATRTRVFALVLSSTLVLSLLVAVVAIAVAYIGVQWWVPRLIDHGSALESPQFPWEAALYGGLAALAAGASGGLVPALAAARVDVIYVLRE